jgi:23S rRNA pseudouridine1911/1915/1917 synthase
MGGSLRTSPIFRQPLPNACNAQQNSANLPTLAGIGYNRGERRRLSKRKSVSSHMHFAKSGPWLEMRITRKQEGQAVHALLHEEMKLPAAVIQELFRTQSVVVNKEITTRDATVKSGDRLRCAMFPEEPYGVEPEMLPLDVLYEDDHLIVVNKAAGMKVHPNDTQETDSLMNALAFHYQMQGLQIKVRQLHRLDQDTSGAILFPKHGIAQKLLDAMLNERTITREYWAVVQGVIKQKQGVIDEPIGRDRNHATRRRVSKTGKPAKTEFAVLERYQGATLVKAKLHTGRTHQIRVHFAHLQHPLLGDDLYGGDTSQIGRQALHAQSLRFTHPITQEQLEIEAPLPDDFAGLVAKLERSQT